MIRLARAADVAAVATIVKDAYSIYLARNGKTPGPMRDDHAVLVADQRVHVLEDGHAIVGLVVLIPEQRTMLLDNVAVSPRAQGRGFGVRLIAFAEARARSAGFGAIRLYTQDIMTENLALYSALGFVETSRRRKRAATRLYVQNALTPAYLNSGVPGTNASNAAQNCPR